jgi:histidyl-tRNA synthetase
VFRNEKPGPGRFRQFMQFDADTVGSASPAADAEMCMMAADAMEALGIKRGDYVVKVSSRKALDELLADILVDPTQQPDALPDPVQQLTVLRAIDKLDRLGKEGVAQLLGAGRKDESGDFTKGAGLPEAAIKAVLDFLSEGWRSDDLIEIQFMVEKLGYSDRVKIDSSVVRGLEYYTGAVFEVELTFETRDEKGRPVRFGSVGGGGRYDGLVSRFRGQPVPATGFSIGVSRLLAALQTINSPILAASVQSGPVLVVAFDRDRLAHHQRMVQTLRNAGIRAEMYLGNPNGGLGPQLKYADRRRAPCAIIQGPDEKARGEVQIKDLAVGAQLAGESKERGDYLAKQAQAQFAVKEENLVEEVKKLLDRYGIRH